MPRPSSVDPGAVIDAAMALFWSRGYGAVSMADLVQATGVARYGLYAAFGDKRGLYLAALGRYEEVVVNRLFAGVEARDAGPGQVRGYFDGLLAMAASPQGRWGCLMANAAVEMAPQDPAIAATMNRHRERLRDGFTQALGGDSPRGDHLVAVAFGIQLQARAGVSAAALQAAAVNVGP